jgi:hypothetical protein
MMPVNIETGRCSGSFSFCPRVKAAKDDGWEGDQKIKDKPDGYGNKNQRQFDRIKHEVFPVVLDY